MFSTCAAVGGKMYVQSVRHDTRRAEEWKPGG